jgi:uncharacterized phage protein gp47/JayE
LDFKKDFDELLNAILTDYKNQFSDVDTSQGSLIFIRSACLASALWGLYKYQEYISKQIFPDTADSEYLDHHGWVWGITRKYNETDAEYLARLLNHIRQRPAGGNKNDYEQWALSIDNVKAAYCYPLAQGLGTVDVVILADEEITGSEIASNYGKLIGTIDSISSGKLIDSGATFQTSGVQVGDVVKNTTQNTETTVSAVDSETQISLSSDIFTQIGESYEIVSLTQQVKDYIDEVRPVTVKIFRVLVPTIVYQDVSMTVTGSNVNTLQIASDIEAYMKTLKPDETLYISQLISIAINNGADNASVSTPTSDVVPNQYEMIRPGVINVT